MTHLLLLCALALSAVAAFYAVAGLMAIFAAAPLAIAIMGSLLEGSKLVIASWLYRNWKEVPRLMKGYLTTALCILMMLTSMGIFGFLSKAHLDQAIPTGDVAAQVALLDDKIKTEKENVDAARKQLTQLDQQVDQTIARTTDAGGSDRAIAIRRSQAKERQQLLKQIEVSQAKIASLNQERAPKASELRKVEAEVGPIKYIAALIYDDTAATDPTLLEKAVRWVTIMIVAVFDPLAVVMLIAANWSLVQQGKISPIGGNSTLPAIGGKRHFRNLRYAGRLKRDKKPAPTEIKETVKEVIKEVVQEAKTKKAARAIQPDEHPVFKPEEEYWVSRPRPLTKNS